MEIFQSIEIFLFDLEFQLDITDVMFGQKSQQKSPFKSKIDASGTNNIAETSSDSMTLPKINNLANTTATDESAMELTGGDESVLT